MSPCDAALGRWKLETTFNGGFLVEAEKGLVEEAARATHVTSSQFVLQAALRSAEEVLAGRTRFVLSPAKWDEFVALHDRPAREIPTLKKAAAKPRPFRER